MDTLDTSWAFQGHLSETQVSALAEIDRDRLKSWLTVAGIADKVHFEPAGFGLLELYKLNLARQLSSLGLSEHDIAALPLAARRKLLAGSCHRDLASSFNFSPILASAERLDISDIVRLITDAHEQLGTLAFVRDFALDLLAKVGENWGRRGTTVASEHLITTALRNLFGAIIVDQGAPDRTVLKVLVTTPYGELHEIGAISASIIAREYGHEASYLGAQLPVYEICKATEWQRANIVCLAAASLDPQHLRLQIMQLREVLPRHVILCLGGRSMSEAGLHELPSTFVYSDMREFAADMGVFKTLADNWQTLA